MSKPLLCVTVTAATTAELRQKRDAVADADLIELRLDTVSDPDVAGALAGRPPAGDRDLPARLGRRRVQGLRGGAQADPGRGARAGRRVRRPRMARALRRSDRAGRAAGASCCRLTTISACRSILTARVHAMRATGAEVDQDRGDPVEPERLRAAARSRRAERTARRPGADRHGAVRPRDARAGRTLRIGLDLCGRAEGDRSAQRPVPAQGLSLPLHHRHHRDLRRRGRLGAALGVAGDAQRGVPRRAPRRRLPAAAGGQRGRFRRRSAGRSGISGASVTIPLKVSLFDQVDEVYSVARRIGAINTIRVENGRWIGGNTDASGFLEPLQRSRRASPGCARRCSAPAARRARSRSRWPRAGARCGCTRATGEQAEETAMLTSVELGPWPPEPGSWDLLINCTPVGMYPRVDETPIPAEHLTGGYVYDLVYNPSVTRLLRDAATSGCADDRRPRNARRAGPGTVSVVDRNQAPARCDEGSRAQAVGGVCSR